APAEDERRALQTLLHPELLGTRFQYLALGKNAPTETLTGFRFAREPRLALGIHSKNLVILSDRKIRDSSLRSE
ncbi:MAG: hypothetical protein QOD64_1014, partial [Verrucomicrobiota bacterium]